MSVSLMAVCIALLVGRGLFFVRRGGGTCLFVLVRVCMCLCLCVCECVLHTSVCGLARARCRCLRFQRQQSDVAIVRAMQGSGGHTAEMVQLLKGMLSSGDGERLRRGFQRVYVVAKTDALSVNKAMALEESLGDNRGFGDEPEVEIERERLRDPSYRIERIDRAREVGQSYITSIVSTLRSFVTTASLVWQYRPAMVVVNGPGTCLPIVVWARVLVRGCRVYYVESIARVDHLSLTGKVLLRFGLANGGFYVQWKALADKLKGQVRHAGRVY